MGIGTVIGFQLRLRSQPDDITFNYTHLLTAISMLWMSKNGMAQIWNIDSQPEREIARISHHEEPISTAMFSPDGRYVVTTGGDHQARFWYWKADDLISQASQRLTRSLTQTELERYL